MKSQRFPPATILRTEELIEVVNSESKRGGARSAGSRGITISTYQLPISYLNNLPE